MRRLAAVLCLVAVAVTPAAGELYQWTDASGVRHYTDDPKSIPEAFRPGARDLGSPRVREAPPPGARRDPDAGAIFYQSGGPIMAAVVVNGVSLRLMVDTGADTTVVSPAAIARAGLSAESGRPVWITGVTGGAVGKEVLVPELEVAGARVGPIRMVVLDLPGHIADGLLGRDVLDHFTLTVDSPANRATLTPR